MKSGGFHMDFMKSGGFHTDFTGEICQISGEIHWISYGFHEIRMKSAGFRKTIARNGKPYVSMCVGCIKHMIAKYNTAVLK